MRGALTGLLAVGLGVVAGAGSVLFLTSVIGKDERVSDEWQRGVNLTAFLPDAYGEPPARRGMLTARAIGTERVALVPTWYMQELTDSAVSRDPDKTPTDESVRAAAETARSLGLEVVVKPHVDVRDGTFRGEILPEDAEQWFASYSGMLLGYANLAADVDADALVVGTELTSMTLDPEPWRELIAAVREVYDGPLTFAANWVDGAESIEFWDELDAIGIDAYMPLLTPTETPSVEELVTAWGPAKVRMENLHERWDKPVLFTELGYESRVGTAAGVGNGSEEPSELAQANAYQAAFEALSGESWFDGIWWWEWSAERLPPGPTGFSPEGKLAEVVLAKWQGPPEIELPPAGE